MASCATVARPGAPAAAPDQERVVLDLRAKNAGHVRHIEELENRIFILEDQLDSRKLAAEQRAPAILPTRLVGAATKGGEAISAPATGKKVNGPPGESGNQSAPVAAASAAGAAPSRDDGSSPVQTSIVAEHAVDYAGEAALGTTPSSATADVAGASRSRPLLRLSSGSTPRGRGHVVALSSRDSGAPEPLTEARDQSTGSTVATAASVVEPDPIRAYRQALETLRAGHVEVALGGFRRFLAGNPLHDYADNAQYWIGECHYDQRQFRAAERAFRNVVERYPRGNKVPDAMLKLGFTLQSLGDESAGRLVLESLARAFPKHQAARLASERLAHPEPPPARAGLPSVLGKRDNQVRP